MIEMVSVDSIKPAAYNPRRIDEDDFRKLCDSVSTLGIIVPIIVNRKNNVIVAGHQRTKAAKAVGITEVPVLYADNVSLSDEVVFNQLHNGTDYDQGFTARIDPQDAEGFIELPVEQNHAKCERKGIVNEVAKLLMRYGNVLSCVATKSGEVFKAPAYAEACRVLNMPAHVYVVSEQLENRAKAAFAKSYGVFSYDHLEKTTWVQGMAQKYRRLTKEKADGTLSSRTQKSRLYERLVIPAITKDMRVLDFGAGKGQYAAHLNKLGYRIRTLEFYHNNGKAVDVGRGKRDIEGVMADIRKNGLYDAVVLDSVLNSVDSPDAERAVMGACSALLKTGGLFFISGRNREKVEQLIKLKTSRQRETRLYFLDDDGFTASFRNGCFYYQKFHTDEQIRNLISEHGFSLKDFNKDGNAWRCTLVKEEEDESADFGIRFEFSLPHPRGRYEYADLMAQAVEEARGISSDSR